MTDPPLAWKCPRRIGFLFPHECTRATPVGCPNCQNGQIEDPYRSRRDRYSYDDYDEYPASYGALAGSQFTEADGVNLIKQRDDFEDDMSAS